MGLEVVEAPTRMGETGDQTTPHPAELRLRTTVKSAGYPVFGVVKGRGAHPPNGLAAIRSQKFGRRYPGCVRSRMSAFMVPNVVAGL